jgi:hypothetical protein
MEGVMQDLRAKREKFLLDAADCELIANLAGDAAKRSTFQHLAKRLKELARDVEAVIAAKAPKDAA